MNFFVLGRSNITGVSKIKYTEQQNIQIIETNCGKDFKEVVHWKIKEKKNYF